MKVVTLYKTNASDIPAMLRQAADSIEREEGEGYAKTEAMVAVQLGDNNEIQIYGWGNTDTQRSYVMLARAMRELLDNLDG